MEPMFCSPLKQRFIVAVSVAILLAGFFFFALPGKSHADTAQLDLTQLASNGNGKVTFKILNSPSGFDFSLLSTAGASYDNSNWVYAISYEGGCPDACVVEWQGQTTTPFYVKLANQTTSIIFNQSVSPTNVPPFVKIPTSS